MNWITVIFFMSRFGKNNAGDEKQTSFLVTDIDPKDLNINQAIITKTMKFGSQYLDVVLIK